MKIGVAAIACALLWSCGRAPEQLPVKVAHLPPTAKDVVEAALASASVALQDESCKTAGTEAGDRTIGRYLSGFLAEQSNPNAKNSITTSVQPQNAGGEDVYICRLMIRHADGEDVWSWGLEFAVKKDGTVVRTSYRCVGAG